MAQQFLADRNGWLSFNASTPILYVTAEDDEFDTETLQAWCDEGFMVKYLPMGKDGKQYVVIAAGGPARFRSIDPTKAENADTLIAFTLP